MPKKKKIDTQSSPATTHSPFGALAGLAAPAAKLRAEVSKPAPSSSPVHEAARKVVVRRETKGRHGKTVTRVSGLSDASAIAPDIKKALGCGASVEAADLIVLGNLVDRVADWLEARGITRVVRGN